MGFPRGFAVTTMVRLPNPAAGIEPVLAYLDEVLQDQDAEITHRGDGWLEFKVPIAARLFAHAHVGWQLRPLPNRHPLSFVSAGTFTVTPLRDHAVVSADILISQYVAMWVGLFALVSGALNPFGSIPAFVFGAAVGLALGTFSYGLARWEFGSWIADLDRRVHVAYARPGRLPSA